MPPLDEGDLLYMPTTDPSISVTKSKELLQQTDKLIKTFPEVSSVHGKIGRADTATDPAPLSMIETVVQLADRPRASGARARSRYFFSGWPDWLKWPFTATFWPEARPITTEELKYGWTDPDGTQHPGLNEVGQLPGRRQRLAVPDREPHQHALDRHQDAGRHQDPRAGPRRCSSDLAEQRRRRRAHRSPARSARTPSARSAATTSTSTSTATRPRATA